MEDDRGLARLLQKRMHRHGFEVDLAHDGREGLSRLGKAAYDVLIVDAAAPHDVSGREQDQGAPGRCHLGGGRSSGHGVVMRPVVDQASRTGMRPMGWMLTGVRSLAPMRWSEARR